MPPLREVEVPVSDVEYIHRARQAALRAQLTGQPVNRLVEWTLSDQWDRPLHQMMPLLPVAGEI